MRSPGSNASEQGAFNILQPPASEASQPHGTVSGDGAEIQKRKLYMQNRRNALVAKQQHMEQKVVGLSQMNDTLAQTVYALQSEAKMLRTDLINRGVLAVHNDTGGGIVSETSSGVIPLMLDLIPLPSDLDAGSPPPPPNELPVNVDMQTITCVANV